MREGKYTTVSTVLISICTNIAYGVNKSEKEYSKNKSMREGKYTTVSTVLISICTNIAYGVNKSMRKKIEYSIYQCIMYLRF